MEQSEHQNILSIRWSPGAPICDGLTYELTPDLSFIKPTERDLDPLSRISDRKKGVPEGNCQWRRSVF
ncbi:hypothetical protein LguiB_010015 [Lonicera macranthoides]